MTTATADSLSASSDATVRRRQMLAAVKLQASRILFQRRAFGLWILALLPALIMVAWVIFELIQSAAGADSHRVVSLAGTTVGQSTEDYAEMFQGLMLIFVVLFGSLSVFGNLVRREILERTLHYSFLVPMTRRDLLLSKYLGGVLAFGFLVTLSTTISFFAVYVPTGWPAMSSFLFGGPGLGHWITYLFVALLGVVGYGAVFLLFGLQFKRPAIAGIVLFVWELGNFLLPPLLKRLSVMHYLKNLTPVPVDEGPFSIVADAPNPALSVLGLLILSGVLFTLSIWKLRRTEVLYGED